MSWISGKYWTGDPSIKPDAWGPFEDVKAAVRENANRIYGIDPVSLLGYWPLWESAGVSVHNFGSFNGGNGSFIDGVSHINNGLSFNGSDGYVDLGADIKSALNTHPEITLWGIVSASALTGDHEIIASGSGTENGMELRYDVGDNSFQFVIYPKYAKFSQSSPVVGKVYSVFGVLSVDNGLSIYVNGEVGATVVSYNAIPNDNETIKFGAARNNDGVLQRFLNGKLYSSGIFATALSANTISLLNDNPYGLLQPITRRRYFLPDGGTGNTYQVTCADGFSFSDSSLRNAIFSAACDEAINLSDNDSNIAQFLAALSDSFGLSDISNSTAIYNVSVHDSLNINDNVTSLQKIIALVDDTISIADVSIVRADIQGIATDSMALSDSLTAALQAQAVVNEIINLSDTISATTLGVIAALVSETFTISDSTASAAALIATIAESLSLSDNAISVLKSRTNVADSFTLNDSSTWASITTALATDGFTLSDDINCRADLISALIENINISDTAKSILSAYAQVSDFFSIADTTFWASIKQAIAEDAFAVSGSVTGLIKIIANAADSITFDDSNNVTATFSVRCDDTVQFAEAIAAIAQFRASVSDGFNLNATAMEVSTLPSGKVSVSFSFKKTTVVFNFK